MEPRTRILFISYILIVTLIAAIGVIPYLLKERGAKQDLSTRIEKPARPHDVPVPVRPDEPASAETSVVSTVHVIDTNSLTKSVRFQIPRDGVYFEEQSDHLYEIMKDKIGKDIMLSYQKMNTDDGALYNFKDSIEIPPRKRR